MRAATAGRAGGNGRGGGHDQRREHALPQLLDHGRAAGAARDLLDQHAVDDGEDEIDDPRRIAGRDHAALDPGRQPRDQLDAQRRGRGFELLAVDGGDDRYAGAYRLSDPPRRRPRAFTHRAGKARGERQVAGQLSISNIRRCPRSPEGGIVESA